MEQIQMVQVQDLHPHEKNPRIDAASVAELVESVRVHGIEVPLVAAPQLGADGYVVLAGHRRLTAAHEVGLGEVPVQVREDLADAREQLAFMATENLHRDQLTAVEESRLVQDMLDLGMTEREVAKQTALGKQRIAERVKLGKLAEQTGQKVHRGQITVDDALLIAEYSDDPDFAEELEAAAGTHMFDYQVSQARRRREDRNRVAEGKEEVKKRGLRLADGVVLLSELVEQGMWSTPALEKATEEDMVAGEEWDELLVSEHAACPGHSATVLSASRWVSGLGAHRLAGTVVIGCDDHEAQHGTPTDHAESSEAEEPAPDPWEELSADDFATAKVHRARHLARALPELDVTSEAVELMAEKIVGQCWRDYGDDENGIELLETLTGLEGKSRVRRKLKTWPLPLLVWLNTNWWDIATQHRRQGEGRQGSTYWDEKSELRRLLEATGYEWTEVEQQAILLATGKAHDAPAAEDEAAEDGEAA